MFDNVIADLDAIYGIARENHEAADQTANQSVIAYVQRILESSATTQIEQEAPSATGDLVAPPSNTDKDKESPSSEQKKERVRAK
ncbi:MAG TPA: hypothetical protein VJN94_08705 [Candidatus Binataceae bacterium]|nr:hypothetical protein [Candidatus Binataceae bacterium]